MKFKVSKSQLWFWMLYILLILGCFVLPPVLEIAFEFVFIMYAVVSTRNAMIRGNTNYVTMILLFPVFLSIVQNIYLGAAAYKLNSTELQMMLTLNVMLAFLIPLFILLLDRKIKHYAWCVASIILIIFVSLISLVNLTPFTSYLSSLRNILAPFVFFYFGVVLAQKVEKSKFFKISNFLIIFVISFGLIEYFIGNSLWLSLNVTKLWNLKGIKTPNLIPANWFASEVIMGMSYLRRMVSSFADPVNLGTFLFWAFMICWYQKKKLLAVLVVICSILTISKGALLGYLIFLVVYMWYRDNSKILTMISILAVIVFAIEFMQFGSTSSAGLHFRMFFRALKVPLSHPFGTGVGSSGVLASVVNGGIANTSVMETGIGMVIVQLGIIGIVTYLLLFTKLFKYGHNRLTNKKVKIIFFTLLFSIFTNAMFNEVALSPNSCGVYFLTLGVLSSAMRKDHIHVLHRKADAILAINSNSVVE